MTSQAHWCQVRPGGALCQYLLFQTRNQEKKILSDDFGMTQDTLKGSIQEGQMFELLETFA